MTLIDKDEIKQNIQRYLIPNTDEYGMVHVEDAERYFLNLLDKAPIVEMRRWNISESNPPKEEQRVVGFDGEYVLGCYLCMYTFRDGHFIDDEGFSYTCSEVTYWQPAPELPNINEI